MNNNRMYSEMLKAARARLAHKNPVDLAKNAGIHYDGRYFHLNSMGHAIKVSYPEYEITPSLQEWFSLVILHYLDCADGVPLSGRWITFAQQKDGMIRGGGFDSKLESVIEHSIGTLPYAELERRCNVLGGHPVAGNADFCADFPFFPHYPLRLQIWFADDEFGASGRLLTDSSAQHYLGIEDAVTLGEIFLEEFLGA